MASKEVLVLLFFSLNLFVFQDTFAQELPPIQNFSPTDYDGENQNWAVTQDSNKHIYVANNHNILEYDGVRWNKYQPPNASIFRSIMAKDSLIFTGQYMEFGYWKKNRFGELGYTSISNLLSEPMIEDEEFWNILELDDWVLFQSLDRIYSYNLKTAAFKIIEAKSNKAHIFNIDGTIYFQNKDFGIYSIANGEPVLFMSGKFLDYRNVIGVYEDENDLVIILDNAKILKKEETGISILNTELDTVLEGLNIYSTAQLKDGSYILGTISNGIYHVDSDGNVLRTIDQQKGINNNTVLSIFQDIDENLWLGLDNGITVVNINSPFNEYVDRLGKLGLVYTSIVFEGELYLGTNQGLFIRNSNNDFKIIKGTDGQVWSLKEIDGTLFCGHVRGTFEVNGDKANLISSFPGTWDIKEVPWNPNILLQGNFNGLSILRKESGRWVLKNVIKGFDISSRFFEFTGNHQVLVNHEYKGLFNLMLDEDCTNVIAMETHPIMGYGSSMAKFGNDIIYTTLEGAFVKNPDSLVFRPKNELIKLLFQDSGGVTSVLLPDKKSDRLWCFTNKGLSYLYSKNFNASLDLTTIPIPSFFRRSLGVSGFENLSRMEKERYLIGISNGFVTLDLNKKKDDMPHSVEISKVVNQKSFEKVALLPLSGGVSLAYKENDILFDWGVPQFNKFDEILYQYQLDGVSRNWSNWTSATTITFNNLKYGDYTFLVRAKIGNTLSENVAKYSFIVSRPWYLSVVAMICYGIVAIILFFIIHATYRSYYTNKQNRMLDLEKKKLKRKKLKTQ